MKISLIIDNSSLKSLVAYRVRQNKISTVSLKFFAILLAIVPNFVVKFYRFITCL